MRLIKNEKLEENATELGKLGRCEVITEKHAHLRHKTRLPLPDNPPPHTELLDTSSLGFTSEASARNAITYQAWTNASTQRKVW